ncbi:MAG: septum formation initiator family protein [Myxococcales bacterium]|nr:septum formation initiator family protein [Myxococcales bacterium]
MRRFSQQNPTPRNRRVAKSAGRQLAERLLAAMAPKTLWNKLAPSGLRTGISWGMNQRVAARTAATTLVAGWMVFTVIGLVRAWSLEGPYQDRAKELRGVESQLQEARARTMLLQSQLKAIDKRAEVRMAVIRQELGMVRPNERVVRFRGSH